MKRVRQPGRPPVSGPPSNAGATALDQTPTGQIAADDRTASIGSHAMRRDAGGSAFSNGLAESRQNETRGSERPSDRGAATRSVLLAAAREVFLDQGYAQAGVTDIVALAGASVGSLYHHFAGKAELYLALYEQLSNELEARTRSAVRECRAAGVTDPMQLYVAGARGYLEVCMSQRELAGMFARGDGPPGFELLWRRRLADWVRKNTEFFARSGEPLDEAVAIVMTGAMMLAVSELSLADDGQRARQLAEGVLAVMSRLQVKTA